MDEPGEKNYKITVIY